MLINARRQICRWISHWMNFATIDVHIMQPSRGVSFLLLSSLLLLYNYYYHCGYRCCYYHYHKYYEIYNRRKFFFTIMNSLPLRPACGRIQISCRWPSLVVALIGGRSWAAGVSNRIDSVIELGHSSYHFRSGIVYKGVLLESGRSRGPWFNSMMRSRGKSRSVHREI